MAVDPNRAKVDIAYESDNGVTYRMTTTQNHATANGGAGVTNQASYPVQWTPRCVYGISADKLQKAKLVIPDPTNALFVNAAGSFTIAGTGTFEVTGASGEKRSRGAESA